MPIAERRAEATWQGRLAQGGGTVAAASGALGELPITWASRTERSDGKTSPEELIAAAHAACFAMALSHELSEGGNPPERVHVRATVTLDTVDGAPTVTTSALEVSGSVPSVDAAGFEAAAQSAGRGCPISRLLAGAEITVTAALEE